MNIDFLSELYERLEKALDHKRFVHTLGVSYTAASLAMNYHFDNVDRAQLAGLMHDVAKCIPKEEAIAYCHENMLYVNDIELRNPALLHAKVGAIIAEEDYWIHDQEILNAIRSHTTGQPNMTLLQKIVYVADYIEPNRDDIIPNIDQIQEIAFKDIDKAVMITAKNSLDYLESKGREIDNMSRVTYEFYKKLVEEREA